MTPGIARALLLAVKVQDVPVAGTRESVFGNPQRRRVFQYLCVHPCGSLFEAARALALSPATVRFHVQRLLKADYLTSSTHGIYPAGFLDADDVLMFEAARSSATRRVLAAVYARPGSALSELANFVGMTRQTVASLFGVFEALGVVARVSDGRFLRVYPTKALDERQERHRRRARQFADSFVQRLAADDEKPEVLRRTATDCLIRFGRGASKAVIELALEPHVYVLR